MKIKPQKFRKFPVPYFLGSIVLAAIVLFCGLPWLGNHLPLEPWVAKITWLRVKEIDVDVQWPLHATAVKAWLPELEGKSILMLDGNRIVAGLEQKPWVKSVAFKKIFPDRLQFQIETKKPIAIAIERGQLVFLDGDGNAIDRVTPVFLKSYDLPVISWDRDMNAFSWKRKEVVAMVERLRKELVSRDISQISLGAYPYFKVFLVSPRTEVLLNWETWPTQLPRLSRLLQHPPRSLGALARIDLTSAKKAIVSSSLSN